MVALMYACLLLENKRIKEAFLILKNLLAIGYETIKVNILIQQCML